MTDDNCEQVLQLRLQKLQLEIDDLKARRASQRRLLGIGPLIATTLPVFALLFAIFQFAEQQKLTRDSLDRQTQAHQNATNREFMAPVLKSQADVYFSAITAASQFTTSVDETIKRDAAARFLELYWGPMIMVESQDILIAMRAMKFCIERPAECSDSERQQLSVFLAASLQKDQFNSWRVTPEEFASRDRTYRDGSRGTADKVLSRARSEAQGQEEPLTP